MHSTDDLELVRELVSEPGPSGRARNRGRSALLALAEAEHETAGRETAGRQPGQRSPARPARPARLTAGRRLALAGGGTAVLAGAAAAAVLIATAGTGAPQPGHAAAGHAAGPAGTAPSAQDVLLTAARQSGSAPAAAGRYWVTRTVSGTNLAVGTAGHRYVITDRGRDEQWTARAAGRPSAYISQSLGARPASAADTAAWRQAGSPRSWLIAVTKPGAGRARLKISAAAGKPFGNPANVGDKVFAIGNSNVSMRQLRRLPATPAGLKKLLLRYFAAPGATGGDLPSGATAWLWQTGTGMVTDMPLSPAQRAAAYRMLAALPGVRSLGRVTDPAGRRGTAVALTSRTSAAGTEASVLIVDPRTGLPLASEVRVVRPARLTAGLRPGALASYQVIKFAGWSDAAPPAIPHS
jgi:hypothetical protein